MILVDWQIEGLCVQAEMIHPFDRTLLNPASLDVRIGDRIRIETDHGWQDVDISQRSKELPFWIEPKEFILAQTLEMFNMPIHVAGEFRIKSSRAREGWNNALAVWLDPGWHGSVLTLELINECRFTRLPIYPGLKIGQIVFHECPVPRNDYAITGRYNGDRTVTGSKG